MHFAFWFFYRSLPKERIDQAFPVQTILKGVGVGEDIGEAFTINMGQATTGQEADFGEYSSEKLVQCIVLKH